MAIKKTKTSSSQKNLSIEKVKTASHQQSTPTREVNTSSVEKKIATSCCTGCNQKTGAYSDSRRMEEKSAQKA